MHLLLHNLKELRKQLRRNDGKDIHHKDGNAMNNKRSNLTVKTASKNRSYPRTKSAGKKFRTS